LTVADELGLPYWWLNEQASVYISGKDDPGKRRVFDHLGLRVMAASPDHIFAMRHSRPGHATLTIFGCSRTSSEWSRRMQLCGYARISIRTNLYPRGPRQSFVNSSANPRNW